jgi:putative nucleotidyltransferase with HDIG domain
MGDRGPHSAAAFRLQRIGLVVAFVVLVAALTKEPQREALLAPDLGTSDIALEDVKAPFEFEAEDLAATAKAQDEAALAVPNSYRVENGIVYSKLEALRGQIALLEQRRGALEAEIREALLASNSEDSVEEIVGAAVSSFVIALREEALWEEMPEASLLAPWLRPDIASLPTRVLEEVPVDLSDDAVENLEEESGLPVIALEPAMPTSLRYTFGDVLARMSLDGLEYALRQGIRPGTLPSPVLEQEIVILREVPFADIEPRSELTISEVLDTAGAVHELTTGRLVDLAKAAAPGTEEPDAWAKLHDSASALVTPWIGTTLLEDPVYTARAKQEARTAVEPVLKDILQSELIQGKNRRWTLQSRSDVAHLRALLTVEERPGRRLLSTLVAHIILVGLVLLCLHRSLGVYQIDRVTKRFNLALLMMCVILIIGRIGFYFEPSGFVIPIAASGILYAILLNARYAAMVGCLTAALLSAQYGYDWRLLIVGGAMTLAGVFSISRVRRRSDMARAAFVATLVGLLATTSVSLAMGAIGYESVLQRFTLVALNGAVCLMAVPGLLPPLERLFGITTDIQLLEFSDLNNELLSRLAIKAPGTYSHSLMLGQVAEAAADAIGANGLLARVCAYYHDIGKMKRSEYFSENQTDGNIHDELSPRLSSRAIASHVIQGAEMAREAHLPKPIVDGILEHHGTCLIGYFYQQAVQQQKHDDVQEESFRYPGPKPQSPETAILMICDAAESGIRSIKNPNEERVREFIDKIIQSRFSDRQFEECDLTLKQLNTISEVVTQRIMTNLHTRVAYPDTKSEQTMDNVIPMPRGGE